MSWFHRISWPAQVDAEGREGGWRPGLATEWRLGSWRLRRVKRPISLRGTNQMWVTEYFLASSHWRTNADHAPPTFRAYWRTYQLVPTTTKARRHAA